MGFFADLFDSKPDYVKNIVKKIEGYSVEKYPEVMTQIKNDAIYYAENEKNWSMIEKGYKNDNKDAEYYSLYFIYLAVKDALRNGVFHVYAGIVSAEGNIACSIGSDCLDRLFQLGFIKKDAAEDAKIHLKGLMSEIGIG